MSDHIVGYSGSVSSDRTRRAWRAPSGASRRRSNGYVSSYSCTRTFCRGGTSYRGGYSGSGRAHGCRVRGTSTTGSTSGSRRPGYTKCCWSTRSRGSNRGRTSGWVRTGGSSGSGTRCSCSYTSSRGGGFRRRGTSGRSDWICSGEHATCYSRSSHRFFFGAKYDLGLQFMGFSLMSPKNSVLVTTSASAMAGPAGAIREVEPSCVKGPPIPREKAEQSEAPVARP